MSIEERINYVCSKLNEIVELIWNVESGLEEDEEVREQLRDYLIWKGYDVKNSCPQCLTLVAINDTINS